jgi:PD-(D/E)XK nuclease superfamily
MADGRETARTEIGIPADAVVVDNSLLAAVAKCDTYDYVTYCTHLVPKGTALAIEAGAAIHLGLAEWMRGGMQRASIPRVLATIRQAYQPAVTAWELREEKPLPQGDRFQPEWVYGIIQRWLNTYSERFPYRVVSDVIERPVAAPLTELKDGRAVWIVARLDARVRKFAVGGHYNLDWKTTKRITDWWKAKTKVRSQFLGQLWIAEAQGEPLEGVILGVIEIPERHRAEFCKTHKRPFKECDLEHATWDWIDISPKRLELPVWHAGAVALARRHLRLLKRAERDGIAGVSEVLMQGRFNESCTFCELREWCKNGRPTRPANVRALFEKRVWDPLRGTE